MPCIAERSLTYALWPMKHTEEYMLPKFFPEFATRNKTQSHEVDTWRSMDVTEFKKIFPLVPVHPMEPDLQERELYTISIWDKDQMLDTKPAYFIRRSDFLKHYPIERHEYDIEYRLTPRYTYECFRLEDTDSFSQHEHQSNNLSEKRVRPDEGALAGESCD